MENNTMLLSEKNIYNFIKEKDYVSFAELIKNFNNTKGEHYISIKGYTNIILFLNISKKLSDILTNLFHKNKIYWKSCHILTYLIDGHLLKLPLAKRLRLYKKPHWFPIVYRTTDKLQLENKAFQKIYYQNKKEKKDGKKRENKIK